MLYKRYGGAIQEVLSLYFLEFIEQVEYAIDKTNEEFIVNRWVNGYQHYSLNEFKEKSGYISIKEMKQPKKEVSSIIDDIKKIFG